MDLEKALRRTGIGRMSALENMSFQWWEEKSCVRKKKKKTANLQKCREVVNVGGGENWTRKMSEWTLQHLQILANTDSARLSRVV